MDNTEVAWAEMSPSEHLVQIYDEDLVFLRTLEGFVVDGLLSGESVVVIATPDHLSFLHRNLLKRGAEVFTAMDSDRYLALDADAMLSIFMVDGWPDDKLFNAFVTGLLRRATSQGRRVRAFGEMVAILCAKGNFGATVRLEQLWHKLCAEHDFMLFCAYPKAGFTANTEESIREICGTHSHVLA